VPTLEAGARYSSWLICAEVPDAANVKGRAAEGCGCRARRRLPRSGPGSGGVGSGNTTCVTSSPSSATNRTKPAGAGISRVRPGPASPQSWWAS